MYSDQELITAFHTGTQDGKKPYVAVFYTGKPENNTTKTVWATSKKEAVAIAREYAARFLNKKLYAVNRIED
jgi:hypothetical protein